MKPASWLIHCALLVCQGACSQVDAPNEESPASSSSRDLSAPIQTDTIAYLLVRDGVGWRAEVPFEFRNTFSDTLFAINCNGALTVAVQHKDEAGWHPFWAPLTNGCFSPPITIPPGGRLRLPWTIW